MLSIEAIFELIKANIDIHYFACFMAMAYLATYFLYPIIDDTLYSKVQHKPSKTWLVLLLGIIIAIPFVLYPEIRGNNTVIKMNEDGKQVIRSAYGIRLFLTYAAATSVHEVVIKQIAFWISKKASGNGTITNK